MTYQDIIKYGISQGIEEIEIYASTTVNKTLKVFNGALESFNSKDLFNLSIRGLVNGKMGYASTESMSDESIRIAINRLINNTKLLTSTEKEEIFDGNCVYKAIEEIKNDADKYSLSDKINLLLNLEKQTLAYDKRVKKVGYCQYVESEGRVNIINSKGVNLERNFSYLTLVCGAFAAEGEETNVGYAFKIALNFKDLDICKLALEAGKKAVSGLFASSVKSGAYPVVFDKEVATDILQAFTGVFSGYNAMKNMTMLNGKVGEKVFGDNITFIDDPFFKNALIKCSFDDEAYPCNTRKVVENGVFKGFFHSLKTAKFFGEEPTGNGFRTRDQIIPSVTNFYLAPGEYSKEQLFEGINEGIYITDVSGLHAGLNVVAGTFNLQSSGYMIRNGRLAEPITLFVVSGSFFDMFNNVEKIGNDLPEEFTDVASPSIKVNGLMISGK